MSGQNYKKCQTEIKIIKLKNDLFDRECNYPKFKFGQTLMIRMELIMKVIRIINILVNKFPHNMSRSGHHTEYFTFLAALILPSN
jgi:hypothetical protein